MISSIITALLAWGMAVSSWKFIAAATLIVLTVCGCVVMATKLVSRMHVLDRDINWLSIHLLGAVAAVPKSEEDAECHGRSFNVQFKI